MQAALVLHAFQGCGHQDVITLVFLGHPVSSTIYPVATLVQLLDMFINFVRWLVM